ncbi:MAG: rRNA maturation RNase YbeY [Alphaproteobacteria bacterium]|nr:rRNA maturation RNase YbeY [Alphaproteobacteria bacterium]
MARPGLAVETRIDHSAWRLAWPRAKLEARRTLLQSAKFPEIDPAVSGTVVVVLTDDERVRELNLRFRGKNKPTNVLSFPDPSQPLGGMALAFETLALEATKQDKKFVNHVKHMILHGFLHLLGFDHQTKREARLMERLETAMLSEMGIPNPYVIETKTRA